MTFTKDHGSYPGLVEFSQHLHSHFLQDHLKIISHPYPGTRCQNWVGSTLVSHSEHVQISAWVSWLKCHCFHQLLQANTETVPQERSELCPSTYFQKHYALIILSFVTSCWSAYCMEFGCLSLLPVNAYHREVVVSVVTALSSGAQ